MIMFVCEFNLFAWELIKATCECESNEVEGCDQGYVCRSFLLIKPRQH